MSYQGQVNDLREDPEQLEQVYQEALKRGEGDTFKQAIETGYSSAPDNLLYGAWFYRLKNAAVQAKGYAVAWAWVVPLAIANGLLFWWLSDDRFMVTVTGFQGSSRDFMPAMILLAAPVAAVFVLIFLTGAGRRSWPVGALTAVGLLAAAGYVFWFSPQLGTIPFQEQYLTLMAMHLPLLAWAGVGAFLIYRHRDADNRFSFLMKSLEVFVVGGLLAIALAVFTVISIGLFQALDVDFPESMQRLFIAGGLGLIVVVATAVIYNPRVPPAEQSFDEGLSKLVALLMRVMIPLTLLVLLVYLFFIPFNFRAPFENRDVLIIYNAMLFAVILLLVGATPVSLAGISPRVARWLRMGIAAVAFLALLISLYALSAILYRTGIDRLTPNRLAFIGWNVINMGLLIVLLFWQLRAKEGQWLKGLHRAFSVGTVAYAVWTLALILALPWLFGIDQGAVEQLPERVQRIVYDQPDPILLKCTASPHIYLLEAGEKRWIDTIETFTDRGYEWRDVQLIPCDDLRSIADGVPIPADAGPPPQP